MLNKNKQSGIALITTIILTSIMLTSVMLVSKEMVSETQNATRIDNSLIAYYAAEAGLEDAMLQFRYDHDAEILPDKCVDIDTGGTITPPTDCGKTFAERYYDVNMSNEVDSITTNVLKDDTFEFYVDTTRMNDHVTLYWDENPDTPSNNGYRVEITSYDDNTGNIIDSVKKFTCPDEAGYPVDIHKNLLDSEGLSGKRIIRVKPWYTKNSPGCPDTPPNGDTGLINGKISGARTGNEIPYITLNVTKGNSSDHLGGPITKIESVGYYGGVQRKIVASIDHTSGNILGVFDYVIYSASDLIK